MAAEDAALVRSAVGRILAGQEPYPAVVLDRHWNVTGVNCAGTAFFGWLLGVPAAEPANVVRLMFDPAGLRPYVRNWAEVAHALILRVHREAVGGVPDQATSELLAQALAQPGVPAAWRLPDFGRPPTPVVPIEFAKGGLALSYFSAVTTLGTPQDAALQEIRIESFFPADESTAGHAWS